MQVLGIEVPPELASRWVHWLMPDRQPFIVPIDLANERGWLDERRALSLEVVDSFELYAAPSDTHIVLLARQEASSLPVEVRRTQPARHRWRGADPQKDWQRTRRFVEMGSRPSRHREVTARIWDDAAAQLPGARTLAGSFAERSGPNCFATVMAAAGVRGVENEWMLLEPFERWLSQSAAPGGQDDDPGTILVWRTALGDPAHAAVTLGGGWLLQKSSQGWMTPRQVLSVRDGKYSARQQGLRLHRYRLVDPR